MGSRGDFKITLIGKYQRPGYCDSASLADHFRNTISDMLRTDKVSSSVATDLLNAQLDVVFTERKPRTFFQVKDGSECVATYWLAHSNEKILIAMKNKGHNSSLIINSIDESEIPTGAPIYTIS